MAKKPKRAKSPESQVRALSKQRWQKPIPANEDLAAVIVPREQAVKHEYEFVNPAIIDSSMPQVLVLRNKSQWAIERYFARNLIDARQLAAGIKFRKCWTLAGLDTRVTANYDRVGVGEATYGMPASEAQAHFRREYRQIMDRLPPRIAEMAVDAICWDKTPKEMGVGSRPDLTGMAYIRLILDTIADYYRIYDEA